ncbi:Gat family PTS system transporter subunit IIC [Clostridium sartagoforme AAU1]|uniref:Gat family PTS system transporter subunit IIC n=1 Tax=Clostridium sartagoforme AAU1 TaxID=1202534 RepID=R9BWD7_9CLOT|nr:PTS transporter subunit IIC [Clostridium sartagoforme]EOR21040.1 Gat family PTS system transporter subunit IIC [Clostridium sartagoforme AAU1]
MSIFDFLKSFFDTFGNYITVPIIIFVICLFFKAPVKKAFASAVLIGVGLKGMAFITSAFGSVLSELVKQIVDYTGLSLPALDIGWQAVASVAYSTNIGMMFIGVGLIFQIILWLIKWTDIFMPSDLWNNYSIIVWGSMLFQLRNNLILAFALMLFINLVTLLISEVVQKRWSVYYKYPGCAMTAPHHMGDAPMYLGLNIIFSKLGMDKIKVNPDTIRKRIGFLGEPMYIGIIVGLILGVVGNFSNLGTMKAWGQIANVTVTCSAVMAIFPKIAGIFASGFTALTDYSRKTLKKSKYGKNREFIISVNDALGYGEAATLTTGLLVIPFAVLIAFLLPGNVVIPVMVLPSLPYMVEVPVCLSNGNIMKSWVMACIVFIAKILMASYWAGTFTQVAANAGFESAITALAGGTLIIGFIMSNCTAGLITMAFLTMNPIIIGAVVVAYLVLYVLFKKNKASVHEYLENLALGNQDSESTVVS